MKEGVENEVQSPP